MSHSNQPLLSAKALTCFRDDQLLFENLSFSVFSGEIWQIAGPNGSGKSSLLRILSGLLAFESGRIDCLTELFYLGHQLGLKERFTVIENLRYDIRYPRPSISTCQALLTQVFLDRCAEKKVATLSQGQRQRLSLTKLLFSKARLWLLDEPLSALDVSSKEFWMEKIHDHVEKGGAVVMTGHDRVSSSNCCLELQGC